MDTKQLKKILARLGLASLLAGAGLVVPASNGWGA
jgi:radical SAM modification target selenobiotic family peptide